MGAEANRKDIDSEMRCDSGEPGKEHEAHADRALPGLWRLGDPLR